MREAQLESAFRFVRDEVATVATYEDHRMAMSFAPLALLGPLQIEEPNVVRKSYPSFWEDVRKLGLTVS